MLKSNNEICLNVFMRISTKTEKYKQRKNVTTNKKFLL